MYVESVLIFFTFSIWYPLIFFLHLQSIWSNCTYISPKKTICKSYVSSPHIFLTQNSAIKEALWEIFSIIFNCMIFSWFLAALWEKNIKIMQIFNVCKTTSCFLCSWRDTAAKLWVQFFLVRDLQYKYLKPIANPAVRLVSFCCNWNKVFKNTVIFWW